MNRDLLSLKSDTLTTTPPSHLKSPKYVTGVDEHGVKLTTLWNGTQFPFFNAIRGVTPHSFMRCLVRVTTVILSVYATLVRKSRKLFHCMWRIQRPLLTLSSGYSRAEGPVVTVSSHVCSTDFTSETSRRNAGPDLASGRLGAQLNPLKSEVFQS